MNFTCKNKNVLNYQTSDRTVDIIFKIIKT